MDTTTTTPQSPTHPSPFAIIQQRIADEVHRGAQFLDTAVPDWFHPSCATPISIADLDISNFSHCILGQLCVAELNLSHRNYDDWRRAIQQRFHHTAVADLTMGSFQSWARAHGFYVSHDVATCDWDIIAQSAWIAEITRRRSQ